MPNFGTFVKRPACSEVIFTEMLKTDDGVLCELVMLEYSLERIMAQEMINKFVRSIKQQTLVEGVYTMPEFGEIELNDSGAFSFRAKGWSYDDSQEVKPLAKAEDIEKVESDENLAQTDIAPKEYVSADEPQKKGKDTVLIIAIAAALVAILAMAYGLLFSTPEHVDLTPQIQIQQTQE